MKNSLLVMILSASLMGCVASDADYAKDDNWFEIGYSDGIKGRSERTYSMLAKLGQVNQDDYSRGYLKGVDEFCNPNHAFQIGLSGTYYEGVCEGTEDAQKFRMEWQRGWDQRD
ncbi:DUF2799 domain-containing protein [Vibrio sp. SCSIO 43136]|uniref:DUF2799 domain-containing protein n=1 Tax=Vibrio sp. SCSIO 43136 TaxID=2819101 RepID=UPI00207511DB|nr:DUF2799 domain-containing protein [Vibrio sp. SCSIO 43136]USD64832.1 DUF2799 domain-containing protein [Vibrio sp. SCSIO 43136]